MKYTIKSKERALSQITVELWQGDTQNENARLIWARVYRGYSYISAVEAENRHLFSDEVQAEVAAIEQCPWLLSTLRESPTLELEVNKGQVTITHLDLI